MKKRGKLIFASLLVLLLTMSIGLNTMAAYVYNEAENRYVYNETDKEEVSITVTVSYDGMPILGQDENATVLSGLPVTIPYFDLANYDETALDEYYRYPTLSDGSYDAVEGPKSIVKRPTGLHMVIYLLERYYLGVPEEECGTGEHEAELIAAAEQSKEILNFLSNTAYETGSRAGLSISGIPKSLYMTNFWGHNENLNYYLNHEFPLEKPNWGSTCDYITLEDGDVIDIAMFTNWDFYSMENSGFAYFENSEATIGVGESFVISNIKRAEKGVVDGATSVVENDAFELYDYYVVDADGSLVDWEEDVASGLTSVTLNGFDQPGTYYVYAVDTNGASDAACRAPAVARVNAVGTINLKSVTAPAPITGVKNGTDMTVEALGLPTQTTIKTDNDSERIVDITWDLANLVSGSYSPSSVAAQTFTVKGTVSLPSYIKHEGVSTEVSVTVSVNEAESVTKARSLIDSIGTVSYTSASKAKIDAARAAYNALPAEGKAALSAKATLLTTAETSYMNLKNAADAEAAKKAEEARIAAAKKEVQKTTIAKLKAKAKGSTGITLSWNKNTKVDGYEVWRSTKANSGYKRVTTIKKNSTKTYTLKKGLKKSTTYYYRVRGYKVINGEKVYTPYTRIIVNLNKTKAIKAISTSGVTYKTSSKKVTLTWSGHESMYSLKGYKIYQSTKSKKGFKAVKTTSSKKVTITKGLKKGKTYYFKIRGYAKVGKKTVYTKYSKVIKVKVK